MGSASPFNIIWVWAGAPFAWFPTPVPSPNQGGYHAKTASISHLLANQDVLEKQIEAMLTKIDTKSKAMDVDAIRVKAMKMCDVPFKYCRHTQS